MAIFSAISYAFAYAASFLAASAGVSFSTAVAIGTAAGQAAIGLTASLISRALSPRPNISTADIQAVISQTDAPRRVYVGRYLAGGIRAFFDVKDGMLFQLVVANHGPIDAFEEFWIDGEPVSLTGNAVDSGDKAGFVFVTSRNGSGQGGNYPAVTDAFPSVWTTNHRLQNQATFLVRSRAPGQEDFSKIFPKSYNTLFQWVIRGQRIYDPRTSATVWSDNAALVIAHYLTHPDGYRLDQSEVDWSSVEAMADWCDLPIAQKAGGTTPNMRLWGYWTLDEEPQQVLDRMKAASGISTYETQDGRIGLIGGPFGDTACTLTGKDISAIQTSEAISEREGYNTLRVLHLAPAAKYEVAEVDAWRDAARLAQEGEIAQEFRLEMCPNTSQARRRGKMQMHDDNRARIEIVTNIVGLKARYPAAHGQRHTILLDYQPQDGSGRVIQGEYEVLDHEFDPIEMQCRIELAKVDRTSEAWNAATDEGDPPVEATGPANDPPPEIFAVLTQVVMRPNERTGLATLQVEAAPIPDRDDIRIQARHRRVGDTAWINMEATGFVARSGIVQDGQQYEAQARFQGVFAGVDDWEPLGPITITVDATPPGQPSELIPSPSGGAVHLSWRNPNGAFAEIRIYRGATTNPVDASLVGSTGGVSGQISEYRDEAVSPETQYRYWVAAANVSGIEGDWTGPATITTP
ncbi:phage tail protein [Paracoccus sp. (in: a-proteobacteria)]|uniref:phage tail protein n=1 Tax=Paracoccus sp. TaxID=267 RepID=UPI0028AF6BE2|nr:phage tail protein [Paracoccus sp. (in: a-proteobacteria)]